MPRRPSNPLSAEAAQALRIALERGAFSPPEATRVLRMLEGVSQIEYASRLGVNVKVIKALESNRGNPTYASMEKIAADAGLRLAFVKPTTKVSLLDTGARAAEERRQREKDAGEIAAGNISPRTLQKRNALRVGNVTFKLSKLT